MFALILPRAPDFNCASLFEASAQLKPLLLSVQTLYPTHATLSRALTRNGSQVKTCLSPCKGNPACLQVTELEHRLRAAEGGHAIAQEELARLRAASQVLALTAPGERKLRRRAGMTEQCCAEMALLCNSGCNRTCMRILVL